MESEEFENRHKALGEALTTLNERERHIFEARRLADEPMTLEELADEFGISRERVRQIEARAFEKVQSAMIGGSALADRLDYPSFGSLSTQSDARLSSTIDTRHTGEASHRSGAQLSNDRDTHAGKPGCHRATKLTMPEARTSRLPLLALALATFGIGTTEFVIMGLMPDVSPISKSRFRRQVSL
jgi:hypothetical protein